MEHLLYIDLKSKLSTGSIPVTASCEFDYWELRIRDSREWIITLPKETLSLSDSSSGIVYEDNAIIIRA